VARWKPGDDVLEQNARPIGVARLEVALGGLGRPPPACGVGGGRQPTRPLPELGRALRGAARPGPPGSLLQRCRDLRIGIGRGEGEVPGAFVGIVDDLRQPGVERAPRRRRRLGIDDRSEERVREPDPLARHLDDSRGLRLLKRGRPALATCRLLNELDRRAREGRDHERDLARLSRKAGEPLPEQLMQRRRHRQRVSSDEWNVPRDQRPPELEREKRIATRDPLQLGERRAQELPLQARPQQPVDRRQIERTERDPRDATGIEGRLESERKRIPGSGPLREQEANRLLAQAPRRERKRVRRRRIEPLHVVDRNDKLACLRKPTKDAEEAQRDGPTKQRTATRFASQERHLERVALRLGKPRQHIIVDVLQEITQGRERQRDLGLDRPAAQHASSPLLRRGNALPPQRRLPDPDRAVKQERAHP